MSENDDSKTQTFDDSNRNRAPIPKFERLGSFKIEKEISSGGGGTVYLAYDESMKRRVALKVLHPSLGITTTAQTRFAREAWIAGQLEHANIIKVYSRGEDNQLNFIALEYAEGGSLSDYIKLQRELSAKSKVSSVTANREHFKSIITKFVDLANGLGYIHSKGFIHRDIKPHNILLAGESRQFKLTDFGIAHAADMTRMTHKGDFIGTVHYMSPEQIAAHRTVIDNRTDIYSLGVTLYEALTLSLPFEADSEEKLISEIISGHSIPARRRLSSIPKDLETILLKATHHDASRRYQSAKDFADDLKRFLELKPIIARPDSIFYKAAKTFSLKKRANQIVLAAVLIVMAGGVIVSNIQQNKYDKERILVSLKRAVETKTSPFEFEPDWPRLQKKLYEHVKKGEMDSTLIWYLKTSSMPIIEYQKYSTLDKAKLSVRIDGIKLYEAYLMVPSRTIAQISNIEIQKENSWQKAKSIFYYYDPLRPRAGVIMEIGVQTDANIHQTGELGLPIRIITENFFNSSFYIKKRLAEDTSATNSNSFDLSKWEEHVGDSWGTSKKELYIAIDRKTQRPAVPAFVDTSTELAQFWIFDKWPADFPKAVRDSSILKAVYETFSISKLALIKRNGHTKPSYEFEFSGNLGQVNSVIPIVGNLQVCFSSGEHFLSGKMQANKGSFDVSFALATQIGPNGWNFKYDDDNQESYLTSRWFVVYPLNNNAQEIDSLVSLGKIEAILKILPSVEVAREYGDVNTFCGDTLVYKINYTGVDSTAIN